MTATMTRLLDILFPPQCLNCRALVPSHGTLCLTCWNNVTFITDPMCDACGLPFEFDVGPGSLCGECLRELPPYAKARAAFRYDDHSRGMVLRLKYHDQTYLSTIFGPWLAKAGKELLADSDVIVPVPLHYWRFVSRRYNQSALLAQQLAKQTQKTLLLDGLKRTRATKAQIGLTREQREKNVRNAFSVPHKYQAPIKGKTILLIDDVMTTGSTIESCAKALIKAGAMRVNVLTLSRTVNG
ncbi:MAG: ComF family protein [Rickettsiales bacterium]|nr:ComF family protein [Rickettsiales bacterium]